MTEPATPQSDPLPGPATGRLLFVLLVLVPLLWSGHVLRQDPTARVPAAARQALGAAVRRLAAYTTLPDHDIEKRPTVNEAHPAVDAQPSSDAASSPLPARPASRPRTMQTDPNRPWMDRPFDGFLPDANLVLYRATGILLLRSGAERARLLRHLGPAKPFGLMPPPGLYRATTRVTATPEAPAAIRFAQARPAEDTAQPHSILLIPAAELVWPRPEDLRYDLPEDFFGDVWTAVPEGTPLQVVAQ